MARYIDKDALLKRWNDVVPRMVRDKDGGIPIDFLVVIHEVSATPALTLDDLRPKGRWVDGNCSLCGASIPTDDQWDFIDEADCHYCYNCGADMRGGGEDA